MSLYCRIKRLWSYHQKNLRSCQCLLILLLYLTGTIYAVLYKQQSLDSFAAIKGLPFISLESIPKNYAPQLLLKLLSTDIGQPLRKCRIRRGLVSIVGTHSKVSTLQFQVMENIQTSSCERWNVARIQSASHISPSTTDCPTIDVPDLFCWDKFS